MALCNVQFKKWVCIVQFKQWVCEVVVRIVGLKQEGWIVFKHFFANFEGVEKANEESKPKEWKWQSYKIVLVDFHKINQLFLRFNQLFLSAINKNNFKTNITKSRERENHTTKFILVHSHQELHPIPINHWVFHHVIKPKLQNINTK